MTADRFEECAELLERSKQYRVLRKLPDTNCYNPPPKEMPQVGVYVDIETTGLNPGVDKIIELAMVSFEFLSDGRIFRILDRYDAFNDPGFDLPEGIVKLTGITDEMVRGQSIDVEHIRSILDKTVVVIAHNATFDRVFLESFFPEFETKAWACSMKDIPWAEEGFEGTKLEYLAWRCGFFFEGHHAITDCAAGIHLLSKTLPKSGDPALKRMLDSARQKEYRIWAEGSPYEAKDVLKSRGYRWNSGENRQPRSWYNDIPSERLKEEIIFLQTQIYGSEVELRVDVITAFNRYSSRVTGP
ncbi:MAG: 3'-5' exonuclease [Chlorobiaceae bacterium]|nr:3'-5' exonuclease [Chlorobiaceae bacterium]